MKENCFKGCFCSKEVFVGQAPGVRVDNARATHLGIYNPLATAQDRFAVVGQAVSDNAPATGHTPFVILNSFQDLHRLFSKRAFTLIELLVVVLIIGILATVALPQYKKAVYKSRYATLKNLTESIFTAQKVYYLAHSQYATKFEELDIDMPGGKLAEKGTDGNYVYDWGHCNLTPTLAECYNSKINMGYQKKYQQNTSTCIVSETIDLTDFRNTLCQSETGASQGKALSAFNAIMWSYQ